MKTREHQSIISVRTAWCRALLWSCLLVFGFSGPSFADQENSIRLIENYLRSVDADEPSRIKAAWNALNQDQEALDHMQKTMPRLAYLFRVRGLYMQIQELQAERPELFGGNNPSVSVARSVQTLRKDLSPQAISQVEKFSTSPDDRSRRRTNQDIVQEARGRPLQDNRTIALSNPNQNRLGNVQYIKNRLDFLYSQKFQEVPEELVPRGNSFPKTRPGAEVDVRIQGLSSEVSLRKTSTREAVFDILLNGRVVINRLDLLDSEESVNLYFEPGMNTLTLVHVDRPARSGVSLIADFKQSVGGQQQIFLDFTPGASRVLQVEAVP